VSIVLLSRCLLFECASTEEKADLKASFVGKKIDALIAAMGELKYTIDSIFDDDVASKPMFPRQAQHGAV